MNHNRWWFHRSSWPHRLARWLMLFSVTGYTLLPTAPVWANPSGEQVVGGAATFHRDGNNLTVNQTSDRLAVNWQDFSIAAGERTHFNMPSAASVALNRVLGGNPSQIYGTLSSNGNIILVNNSGIFVGPGGMINAASFVGSTLDIDPDQFMSGAGAGLNLHGDSYAPIVNQGNIRAEKGDVFLIAQKVENRGTISAPNGRVGLVGVGREADRTEVVLHEVGGSGFAVRVAQLDGAAARGSVGELPDGEELLNEGEIAAAQAELNASGNIYALAIRNSGTIRAAAVVANADGTVRLDGGRGDVLNTGTLVAKNAGDEATAAGGQIEVTGQNITASPESIITAAGGSQGGDGGRVKIDSQDTTIVQGQVDVAAPSAGAKGGKVELLGQKVGLFDGAKVDASGGAGGGTVLVGGDYLGGRPPAPELAELARLEAGPVKNADATVMATTAEIRADGTIDGDGGKIILWSEQYTGFFGQLFARGGEQGGDGGFIETSSKDNLQAGGIGFAQAPRGEKGLWLLDPLNVAITSSANFGGVYATSPTVDTWLPNAVNSNVNVNVILASLALGNNVLISTFGSQTGGNTGIIEEPGNILVGAGIDNSATANATGSLTLRADNTVTVDAAINIQGSVTISAIGGEILLNRGITSIQGDVAMSAATGVESLFGANLRANAGSISLTTSTGDMSLSGSVRSDFGTVSLSANASSLFLNGGVTSVGQSTFFGANGVTVSSTINTGTSNLNISCGNTGDININSPMSAGTLNISAGSDGADASIIFNGGANLVTAANDINLASRNNITFNLGSDVYLNNGVNRFDLFSENGSIDGGGTVRSGAGVFLINAENNVNLRLGSDTGTVTMDISATTGNISISSPNNITLAVIDSPFSLDAPSEAGSPSDPKGDITISATGVLDMNGTPITGGRVVSLTATQQIILNGGISAGGVLGLAAPAIDIAPTGIGINIFTGGEVDSARGMVINGALNSLDQNPDNAGSFTIDLVLDGGERAILELYGLVGATRPLASFASFGGLIRFFATGASDTTPSIAVVETGTGIPNQRGTLNFDSTDLQLFQDSYFRSQGDMFFGGTVSSGLIVGQEFSDRFSRFDVETIWRDETITPGGGQIIFNDSLGTAVSPLGHVHVVARGQRPDTSNPLDPTPTLKDAQISINGGIITMPGVNPLNPGSDGGVYLSAHGAVVVTSTINTRGGPTVGQETIIGGNVKIESGAGGSAGENENIQLGGDRPAGIQTRGGFIEFAGPVYLVQAATLNTTAGNVSGNITFNDTLDGVSAISLDAGIASVKFVGDIGSLTPSGLTILASKEITFDGDVIMGGAYILNANNPDLGGVAIVFNETVNGNSALTINSRRGEVVFNKAIGGVTPISSLTIAEGADDAPARFRGNVSIQGTGGFSSSKRVLLGDESGDPFTIETNGLTNFAGGSILFNRAVFSTNPEMELVLDAGTRGRIFFGEGLSSPNANQIFRNLWIQNGGSVEVSDQQVVRVNGLNLPIGKDAIRLGAPIFTSAARTKLFFEAENGVIRLERGAFLSGQRDGESNNSEGASLTITAINGDVISLGTIDVSGGNNDVERIGGSGFDSGTVTISASGVIDIGTIQASGGNASISGRGGNGAEGGIDLQGLNIIVNGALISDGGNGISGSGGNGGSIQLKLTGLPAVLADGEVWNRTRESFEIGSVYARGGASSTEVGGNGGSVSIIAENGFLVAPTSYTLTGGEGADDLLIGQGGLVKITTKGGDGDIFFAENTFTITGDGGLEIGAGRNLVFKNIDYLVDVQRDDDPDSPTFGKEVVVGYNAAKDRLEVGGVVLTLNAVEAGATATTVTAARRGNATLKFSQAANGNYEYDERNNLTAGLYIPSNGYIISRGGGVTIDGGFKDDVSSFSGNAVLSGILTSVDNLRGGRLIINNNVEGELGNVVVNSALETFGGAVIAQTGNNANTSTLSGKDGGDVTISGRNILVNRINTQGSASLATATVPAIGGSGGDISITTEGGVITLRRDILAGGGQGLGTRDATGGSGGNVSFTGNLTLNTGESSRTTVTISTLGGEGRLDGESGQGGDISWNVKEGAAKAFLMGSSNSNILALNYGSGIATLGNESGIDAISLGELITAGNNARSNGLLVIDGILDLQTLTTFAQGYSVAIFGDAAGDSRIANAVNFLNTGFVFLGAAGRKLTFTGGFDTLTGSTVGGVNELPDKTFFAGELVTGSAGNPGSGAGMTTGITILAADTRLNSNGNAIEIGQLDGTSPGGQNLTLTAGIGAGSVTFNTSVGATISEPDKRRLSLGDVVVEGGGVGATTSVTFRQDLFANKITSGVNSLVTFEGSTDLAEISELDGTTVLNNVIAGEKLVFSTGGGVSRFGVVQLQGVEGGLGIEFKSTGSLSFTEAVTGPVNLFLGGSGLKDFQKAVSVGSGTGASVQLEEGFAQFLSLTTASGITSAGRTTATLLGNVTLNAADATQTDFNGTVELGNITFTSNATGSTNPVRFDQNVVLLGNATLTGPSLYLLAGTVEGDGAARTLTLGGLGEKTFLGVVGGGGLIEGIQQADNSGRVRFSADVTTQGSSSFAGSVILGGILFTSGGSTTFGSTGGGDSLTLAGNAELNGVYDVNAALAGGGNDLTLSGAGLKQFDGAVSRVGTLSLAAGVTTFNSTLGTASLPIANLNQTGGTLNLNGNANVSGATLLNVNLGSISFANTGATVIGGTLTTTGTTVMTSSTGFTLAAGNSVVANGSLSLTGAVTLSDAAAFGGTGSLTLNSGVVGDFLLSLNGGRQTFVGAVDIGGFSQLAGGTAEFRQNVVTDGGDSFLGTVVLAGSQFTSGAGASFNTVNVTGSSGIGTTGDLTLTGLLTLGSSLQLTDGGGAAVTSLNAVNGTSANLTVTTDNLSLNGAVNLGTGRGTISKADESAITVGGGAGFLSAADLARFTTSGGLNIETDGNISLDDLTLNQTAGITGPLGLVSRLGDLGVVGTVALNSLGGNYNNLTIFGALDTGGFQNLTLRTGGLTYNAPRSLSLSGVQTAGGIDVSTVGSMSLSGAITANAGNVQLASGSGMNSSATIRAANNAELSSGGSLTSSGLITAANNAELSSGGSLSSSGTMVSGGTALLLAGGSLNQSGTITAQGGSVGMLSNGNLASSASVSAGDTLAMSAAGDITMGASYSGRQILLDPSGNLISNGARFQSGDIRARTKDFFANYPNSAAIPGLSVVVGVTSLSQLGPNQIGIELPLLAGSGGPFITEFTTGTGQPYILATQNAVPMVMSPTAIQFANALATRVRYSQEELEMMTPEERAALEASRRQTAARVILQKESGEEQEIGLPADGEIPQAKAPEKEKPAPTAQVYLHGKPLADKSDKDKGDSTQLLRLRPSRSVALRPEGEVWDLMEGERLAAEVNTVSIPLAGK